jgi:hypothetical protein
MSEWWYGLSKPALAAVIVVSFTVVLGGIWFGGNWLLDPERGSDPDPVPSVSSVTPGAGDTPGSPGSPDEPSATATPANPAWEEPGDAGGRAFTAHWFDVFNKARATGDTRALLAISADDCENCTAFAKLIKDRKAAGGFDRTAPWEIVSMKDRPTNNLNLKAYKVLSFAPGGKYRNTTNGPVLISEPDKKPVAFFPHIAFTDQGWRMTRLDKF